MSSPAALESPAAPALLGCKRLEVGRHTTILRDVDLAVRAAEAWFVLGPNGSGKSTLVATLLGLLPARGGEVLPVANGTRRALGYVPQQQRFDLPLPITVTEFVALGVEDGIAAAQVRADVRTALAALGIAGLAPRRVQTLSLGQQRRVLIARALARRPLLLVLDEPTANLDEDGAAQLAGDLERLRREHRLAIVHIAHDRALARRFATHIAWVADGAVRCAPNDARGATP
jgi:zinc transport system ATP-binding protein